MNINQSTPVRCPRCRAEAGIVVLGRNGRSILFECHSCLTLQVIPLTGADAHAEAKRQADRTPNSVADRERLSRCER
ncbi:MAG: hypothetical protein O3C40_03465 [Planctomycetota bacterium]|nr:hypothetical protein [Planctomycetota bacterium]